LEEALIPMPLLANPLAIAMPATPAAKLKGSSSLLTSCRGYVENNIKKRMELITEAWETSQTMTSLGTRAHNLLEHLQADLKDEEHFYLDRVLPFHTIVNNMTETRRRQQDLPSKNRISQLNACWKEKVKNLHLIVQSCEQAISKKEKLFTKLTKIDLAKRTNDFQDRNLIVNSLPLTKKAFDRQVDIFKALSLEKFYSILEYGQDDVNNWLVDYSVQNEEIDQALRNISINFSELENELFNIKIRNEINVAPMRSYIEEWLERELKQVADERQQAVATIPVAVDDINEKTSARKLKNESYVPSL
jgi:hypothetical protein